MSPQARLHRLRRKRETTRRILSQFWHTHSNSLAEERVLDCRAVDRGMWSLCCGGEGLVPSQNGQGAFLTIFGHDLRKLITLIKGAQPFSSEFLSWRSSKADLFVYQAVLVPGTAGRHGCATTAVCGVHVVVSLPRRYLLAFSSRQQQQAERALCQPK